MLIVNDDDPPEIAKSLAQRVRLRRLELDYTQRAMARRAGMSISTYRRFESTGEISLHRLILIGMVLGLTDDFASLFTQRQYASLDEVINRQHHQRRRGARND